MNPARVVCWCLAAVIALRCVGGGASDSTRAVPQPATAPGVAADGGLKHRPTPEAAAPTPAANEPTRFAVGPAVNWTFPVFTDKEGYRQLLLRGTEARAVNANQIEVTGFHAVVFSGDATERVDTVLLSPQATFHPRENRATGAGSVRLILSGHSDSVRDDVELTGRQWTYDHASKKVSIARDVRVTFHAQLNDILK